ncbi:hypothetical protein HBI56_099160 [Parastagonospora nodorum]|nr:hypothetical protein HBH53_081600 [Parastagonospora nodorum]KAH3975865.1 hypothetical protein HBH51_083740 [Parastagonospora nodorum]KAH3985303.1 hypothetical protein HBH52_052750 [Parastagonospora nodorum]KAH4006049.1 hypothetical protein HBI10_024910 [Parastagonospora nodorum]KAH4022957.1 hypothetical protein HBI13_092520 [Parastagonospora nodorum]
MSRSRLICISLAASETLFPQGLPCAIAVNCSAARNHSFLSCFPKYLSRARTVPSRVLAVCIPSSVATLSWAAYATCAFHLQNWA